MSEKLVKAIQALYEVASERYFDKKGVLVLPFGDPWNGRRVRVDHLDLCKVNGVTLFVKDINKPSQTREVACCNFKEFY